jgi:hypothetical protein
VVNYTHRLDMVGVGEKYYDSETEFNYHAGAWVV